MRPCLNPERACQSQYFNLFNFESKCSSRHLYNVVIFFSVQSLLNSTSMRLLTHNFMVCNVSKPKCDKNNFPLIIEVEKSVYRESDFSPERVVACVKKLDWMGLYKTVISMGETNFPKDPSEYMQNEQFLKKLHRILFDTHILSGKLICPNCKREYPISNGIPNMILHESEL